MRDRKNGASTTRVSYSPPSPATFVPPDGRASPLQLGEQGEVEPSAQELRSERLGREVHESDVESRPDLLPDHAGRVLSPEGNVDRAADASGDREQTSPLVGGLDRARDHPAGGPRDRTLKGRELGRFVPSLDSDRPAGFPPRLGLERDELEVGRVEQHRFGVPRTQDDELVDGPALGVGEVRRVDRVLAARDQRRHGHRNPLREAEPGAPTIIEPAEVDLREGLRAPAEPSITLGHRADPRMWQAAHRAAEPSFLCGRDFHRRNERRLRRRARVPETRGPTARGPRRIPILPRTPFRPTSLRGHHPRRRARPPPHLGASP